VTPAAGSTFSDEQLAELLELLGGADSVELKLSVGESDHHEVAASLGIDPLDAQLRQVYFFDTPDLALDRQGVVLRARRVQRKDGDSVVKLRPVVPTALPRGLRSSRDFHVEVDAMPGGFVCSGALKQGVRDRDITAVVAGEAPLSSLFSKAQRQLLARHAPEGPALDDLVLLGPILVLKLKKLPEELERRLVAELWLYPDNSRVLELSTKCEPGDAFLAAAQTRVFLSRRGVDLSAEQQTKTRKALEFFSSRLREG
jgi:hypothetical protein